MSVAQVTDVLVVAAHSPELAGLRELIGGQLGGRVADVRIAIEAVGIGLPAAAVGTATALRAHAPACVVLVGTCGAYDPRGGDLTVAQPVIAKRLLLASTAAAEERGAFPGPMAIAVETDVALSGGLAGESGRRVDVATTLSITTDDVLASRVADAYGCEVEHLEAFAVASACARERVPVAAVLAVANRVGSRARDEWRRHHVTAGKAATDWVAAWLRRGAPGAAFKK
jgi:nucleoside phosphorylase